MGLKLSPKNLYYKITLGLCWWFSLFVSHVVAIVVDKLGVFIFRITADTWLKYRHGLCCTTNCLLTLSVDFQSFQTEWLHYFTVSCQTSSLTHQTSLTRDKRTRHHHRVVHSHPGKMYKDFLDWNKDIVIFTFKQHSLSIIGAELNFTSCTHTLLQELVYNYEENEHCKMLVQSFLRHSYGYDMI